MLLLDELKHGDIMQGKKYNIAEIKIPDPSYKLSLETDGEFIKSVSKINFFIGENNTGKSRLLRILFSKDLVITSSKFNASELLKSIRDFSRQSEQYFEKRNLLNNNITGGVLELAKKISNETTYLSKADELHKNIVELLKKIESIKSDEKSSLHNVGFPIIGTELEKYINECFSQFINNNGVEFSKTFEYPDFKKIYIPILRGIRPFSIKSDKYDYSDYYRNRIISDYFPLSEFPKIDELEIFTGISTYMKVKEHLLGNLEMRKQIKDYEKYLSKNFFRDQEIALIPSEQPHNYLTIKIGKEKERPISKLGDGIQSIIIITLPLFLNKEKEVLLFIDEPEQYMHPGLQRKLLETLLNQKGFEHFQYFITTHSNHFLDLSMDFSDISIFSLQKEFDSEESDEKDPTFIIENLSAGDRAALDYLGVRNSSVFLSNCTIWVEGVTDRWYLRRYLDLYQKQNPSCNQFQEDYHFSFVEYSGNNITHWSFLDSEEKPMNVDRLCGRLFLIADRDNVRDDIVNRLIDANFDESSFEGDDKPKAKERRLANLKKILDDRFYQIKNKEIENILSPEVIKGVLDSYGESNIPDFNEDKYKDKNLGEFIDTLLGDNKKRQGSYRDNNTISAKTTFCKRALDCINEWDDLTKEAQELTEEIYSFISDHNPQRIKSSQDIES